MIVSILAFLANTGMREEEYNMARMPYHEFVSKLIEETRQIALNDSITAVHRLRELRENISTLCTVVTACDLTGNAAAKHAIAQKIIGELEELQEVVGSIMSQNPLDSLLSLRIYNAIISLQVDFPAPEAEDEDKDRFDDPPFRDAVVLIRPPQGGWRTPPEVVEAAKRVVARLNAELRGEDQEDPKLEQCHVLSREDFEKLGITEDEARRRNDSYK